MEYTVDNINTMIKSINDNTYTIKEMLGELKANCAELNKSLGECATKQITLTNEQINAYQHYIREYELIKNYTASAKDLVIVHAPVKLLSDITSIVGFCGKLLTIHHEQLDIIERLCNLLKSSNDVIKLIA